MPTLYKFTAWWGGQEGSLLLWAWLLSTYAAIVVFQNRRKFRDMMPYVIGVLMATEAFFLFLITFVASPFKVLAAGKRHHRCRRRPGTESAAAVLDHGDPSADAVPGLRGIHGAVRVRDRIADHASSRATPGFTPRAAGPSSPGCSRAPAFCSARAGLTRCSDGAATGAGIRWRTPRCCPGSPPPPSCTR